MSKIDNDWLVVLQNEFKKKYYRDLYQKVLYEYEHFTIYPKKEDLFNAFHVTPYKDVKVVILGQDPYFNEGQAHGMCFSVKPGVKIPPSLMNIYKELNLELGLKIPNNGYLMKWAKQGVFLLNTVLTVRKGQPNSHKDIGWINFTDAVIELLNKIDRPVVFLLWGNNAKEKKKFLNNKKHLVLEASHPSPFAANRGFFNCNHFKLANEFLEKNNIQGIDWQIDDI